MASSSRGEVARGEGYASYEVWLCTDLGRRLALLDGFTDDVPSASFEYAMIVNGQGAFTITTENILPLDLMAPDRQIQIWRQPRGRTKAIDFLGLLRYWDYQTNDDGLTTLILKGPDQNELAGRRIVAYPAEDADAQLSAVEIDDGMKDIILANLGSGAASGRDLSSLDFTIAADQTAGPTTTKGFSWREVPRVLRDLVDAAYAAGTEVFWAIVPYAVDPADDRVQLQFRTWTGQPGADRTWENNASNPTIFGLEWGNIRKPHLIVDRRAEANYIYAGGQGEKDDREIVEVSDDTLIGASVWNRREAFTDARNEEATAGVTAAANARLAEGRPREVFSAEVLDTEDTPYGTRWALGDKLTISYLGRQFDEIVRAVHVSMKDGQESVWGSINAGVALGDVASELSKKVMKLERQVEFLSTLEDTKYKGKKAGDLTTTDLPFEGQYGYDSLNDLLDINLDGSIRSVAIT